MPSHQELVGEAMYPSYLVLATSALGLAAAHKLMVSSRRCCWCWCLPLKRCARCLMAPGRCPRALPSTRIARALSTCCLCLAVSPGSLSLRHLLPCMCRTPSVLHQQPDDAPPCCPVQTLGLVPRTSYWLLLCTYCAKLFMLALPEAYLVTPITLLLLAATAPMYVHKADAGRRSRLRLAPWQVLLHVLACLLAVALARFAVFDLVQWLLMARPPEGLLLGCLVLTAAGSLVPLVVYGTPGSNGGQKALALLALGGGLHKLLHDV